MIPGTTPAATDDVGDPDPVLVGALAAGDPQAVNVALVQARLLVPVVAEPSAGEAALSSAGEAGLAVPVLVAADGRRGLPVFSSYAALRAWRPDARPVPMSGRRVVAGALTERYDGVVLDVVGPVPHEVAGADLRLLGELAAQLGVHPDPDVVIVTEAPRVTDS